VKGDIRVQLTSRYTESHSSVHYQYKLMPVTLQKQSFHVSTLLALKCICM